MSGYTRIQVALAMEETGLVPLFYHHDAEICKKVISACHDGGAKVFEFTNRGDFAHEVFPTAAIFMQMGADFIVSPVLNPDVAKTCNRRKVLWIPGCGTLTEISQAEEFGAEIVKVFPGNAVGGPSFVKAVKGPCPWTSIMPTGGVEPSEENLEKWFTAGVTCVGMGSALITEKVVKAGDWGALTVKVKETLAMIRKFRTAAS